MRGSPNPSNHVLSWISGLLTLVGVPATIYLAATQHPWWYAVSLGLVFVFILIVKEVWQKEFQGGFVKAIADSIRTVKDFPSRWLYQRNYCNDHRRIYDSVQEPSFAASRKFESSSPESEQIFIPPFVSSKLLKESPSDLGKKLIEHYLASDSKPLVILGGVGMGKSTLLQHIAQTIVDRKKRLQWEVSYKLPFYLSLGLNEFITQLKENKEPSLADALEVVIKVRWKQPPPEWIERRLKKGQCLILLDGLDEVANIDIRQQVVRWIEHQITVYNKNRFVITSRPQFYLAHPLQRVSVLYIRSFTLEQIDNFIDKWYRSNPHNFVGAKELKDQLRQSKYRLHHLACIPLLLRMIIIVHQYLDRLPESRIQLYEGIFEVYLGKRWRWREAPRDNGLSSVKERQKILQALAYKMTEREILEIDSREAEDLIKAHFENMSITTRGQFLQSLQDNGILVQLPKFHYKFAHRSFQEYLSAMYVKDIQQPELLVNSMNSINLKWWHETIVLYCAQTDPTPIVEACLKEISLSKDVLDLALALYFWEPEVKKNIEQQKRSKPEVRRIWEQLDQTMSSAMEDKGIKLHDIANALLRLRRKYLIPDDEAPEEEPTKDTSFITCAEYQLFLDQPENQTRQPDHWKEDRCPRGQWLKPVLGVRLSDANAFCHWLSAQEETSDWHYRLPTPQETQDIVVVGEAGRGYWIKDGDAHKIIWVKEGPLQSSILSQGRLDDLSAQDNSFIVQDDLEPEYAPSLALAHMLMDVCRKHEKLVTLLVLSCNRIREHQDFLSKKYNRANDHKKKLDKEIDQVKAQKAEAKSTIRKIESLRAKHKEASNKRVQLEETLKNIPKRESELNKEQSQIIEQWKQLYNRYLQLQAQYKKLYMWLQTQQQQMYNGNQQIKQLYMRIYSVKQSIDKKKKKLEDIQRNIEVNKLQRNQIPKDLENVIIQESKLTKQLEGTNEEERRARQNFESASNQQSKLKKPHKEACYDLDETRRQLSSFSILAQEFDAIYNGFSCYASSPISNALARNQTLDLDYILIFEENENALNDFCDVVNRSIQELTNRLDDFFHESGITFADILPNLNHAVTSARDLADQFNLITSKRYIQELDHLLWRWLHWLYENRSRVRSKRRTCLYIRYFAKIFALYQSYADSFLIAQSVFSRYSDIYIAFALLEERINGNLSASEGILIVKEPRGENRETIWLMSNLDTAGKLPKRQSRASGRE